MQSKKLDMLEKYGKVALRYNESPIKYKKIMKEERHNILICIYMNMNIEIK